jgi:hypothetical protein
MLVQFFRSKELSLTEALVLTEREQKKFGRMLLTWVKRSEGLALAWEE